MYWQKISLKIIFNSVKRIKLFKERICCEMFSNWPLGNSNSVWCLKWNEFVRKRKLWADESRHRPRASLSIARQAVICQGKIRASSVALAVSDERTKVGVDVVGGTECNLVEASGKRSISSDILRYTPRTQLHFVIVSNCGSLFRKAKGIVQQSSLDDPKSGNELWTPESAQFRWTILEFSSPPSEFHRTRDYQTRNRQLYLPGQWWQEQVGKVSAGFGSKHR